ncbi:aldehyde dehydrogenase family protein [Klebsiella pneumoniae]|nr:aldehyde dehydrogenase family protein [Klebsiella pneumoniae]
MPAHLKAGNFLRPTVLADVDRRMRVARKRIAWPGRAACCRSKTKRKGCAANDVEYGLASYLDQDVSKVLRLARVLKPGWCSSTPRTCATCVNRSACRVKASGTGHEGGEYSFEVFAGNEKRLASRWATIRSRNGV